MVKSIFDVDRWPLNEMAESIEKRQGRKPETGTDFRRALEDPDIDAQVIAAPDHWHAPAPRTPYRDNIIYYNWHWFWKWGTGEIINKGTHEYDVARWALGVDLPSRVCSSGGRFHFKDDWEFYDVQNVTYDFPEGKTINWEGRSANGFHFYNRGRGVVIHGTAGTVKIDRDGYILYNMDNEEVSRMMHGQPETDALDTIGGGRLTDMHIRNFAMAIREGEELKSPIADGQKSVLAIHLGNISQYTGRSLNLDPRTGRIIGDSEAMSMWGRRYQPGWEPVI